MARSLPKVCPFLVTVDLKLKWPELPVARITPPYLSIAVRWYSKLQRGFMYDTVDGWWMPQAICKLCFPTSIVAADFCLQCRAFETFVQCPLYMLPFP